MVASILIVSKVRLYGEGLATCLGSYPAFLIVGVARNFVECLEFLEREHVDVVLIDMATGTCLETVRAIVTLQPEPQIIALALSELDQDVIACAEAGVSGYVTRDASMSDVRDVVVSTVRGEFRCSPTVARGLLNKMQCLVRERQAPDSRHENLTRREKEIATLMEKGMSNKEIARALVIEVPTVKNHVHNILRKLKVRRRGEAAAILRGNTIRSRPSPLPGTCKPL